MLNHLYGWMVYGFSKIFSDERYRVSVFILQNYPSNYKLKLETQKRVRIKQSRCSCHQLLRSTFIHQITVCLKAWTVVVKKQGNVNDLKISSPNVSRVTFTIVDFVLYNINNNSTNCWYTIIYFYKIEMFM